MIARHLRRRREIIHGEPPKRHDEPGRDDRDLFCEVRLIGSDLGRKRIAIFRRPALHDVRDVRIFALPSEPPDHVVEELSAAPHEGTLQPILVRSRRFADEHHRAIRTSFAEHKVRLGPQRQ